MFLDCPKQLWHKAVAPRGHPDKIPFVQSEAQKKGDAVDAALTARVATGTPLPAQYAPFEPMMQVILSAPGAKFAQMEFALDQTFKPCGVKDWDRAWVRVKYDVAVINGTHGFIGDYKNGKLYLDEDQNRLFATVGFHALPEVEVFDTSYIWLQHGVTSDKRYTRRELGDLWQTFLPDVERMQAAYKANHWPAIPANGKRTCAYCGVNAAGKCTEAQGPYKG